MQAKEERKEEDQRRKERQEKMEHEERMERQARQEQFSNTMQTVQLKVLSEMFSKPTGCFIILYLDYDNFC